MPDNAVNMLHNTNQSRATLTSVDVACRQARKGAILFAIELQGGVKMGGKKLRRSATCMKTRFHSSRTLGSSLFTRDAAFLRGGIREVIGRCEPRCNQHKR